MDWCFKLKESWLKKDVKNILELFSEDVVYYESPFCKIDNLLEVWEEIKSQEIKRLDYEILCENNNVIIANFKLEDQLGYTDMIYEIRLNLDKKCYYFKQWYMVNNVC